jgi:hypothetical protein
LAKATAKQHGLDLYARLHGEWFGLNG